MKKFLAACIIESRSIENLEGIIRAHMDKLPSYTELVIYHSGATEYLKEKFPSATFILIEGDFDIHRYNHLLTTESFWNNFLDYHRVLIFQSDSMILRTGIEEFFGVDYVGSPWLFQEHGFNGGCSLRNPKAMLEICSENKWNYEFGNEDVFYSNIMFKNPQRWKLATREVGLKFGVESVFSLGTFCSHAMDKYLPSEKVSEILNQYK